LVTLPLALCVGCSKSSAAAPVDLESEIDKDARSLAVDNGGFENDAVAALGWQVAGTTSVVASAAGRTSYLGRRALLVAGTEPARITQTVPVDADTPRVHYELGTWFQVEALNVPAGETAWLELDLFAKRGDVVLMELATVRRALTPADVGRWLHLLTEPGPVLPQVATGVELELETSGVQLRLDVVQAGPAGWTTGMPRKHAAASYVGWYRSPFAPGSTGSGVTPRDRWHNWAWLTPPFEDRSEQSLAHNPDCDSNTGCLRSNGRRDIAVSPLASEDHLPLIGSYDSRDDDVLRYHVELAQAIGFDAFVYTYNGQAVAEQSALPGEQSVNAQTLERLLAIANEPANDLKIAIMYEPKVHMQGWVDGELTFEARKQGIVQDLIWFVELHGSERAILRRRGRIVAYVFWQNVCMEGSGCLNDDDWRDIRRAVRIATGEDLVLIGTTAPDDKDSPLAGFLNWRLVDPSLLRYASYAAFQARQPSVPAPTAADARAFALELSEAPRAWAFGDPERFAVSMVWPGFDDSGVAGWSQPNGVGDDGQPLRVRVLEDLGPAFLDAAFDVALDSDADWLHVATWNDWNERTAIEPAWSADYVAAALAGIEAAGSEQEHALGRALQAQQRIAEFKGWTLGQEVDPAELEAITRAYLLAAQSGGVTAYD